MNRNSTLALLCAAVALPCAASATAWNLDKGNTITAMPTAADDYEIYYSGASDQKARIGDTDNKWIHYYPYTLTLKAAGEPIPGTSSTSVLPTNWNFLGCFEMDLKAASGNINIIKNETSSAITYQIGHIDVINSVENSTAKAVIDAGGGRLLLQGGSNIQTPTLNLNVDTTITTTSTHAAAIELNQYSAINLAAGKTLSTSNKVTMLGGSGKGSNITTGAGSTLSTFATFTMDEYSSVNIGGTWTLRGLSMSNSASADVYYFNPGSGFTVTLNKGTSLITRTNTTFVQTNVNGGTLTQNAGTATTLSRWFTLQNGGNFSTAGYVKIDGNSDPTHAAWAKLTIAADAGNFFIDDTEGGKPRVVIYNGEVIFNKENAITTSAGDPVRWTNVNTSQNVILRINASQVFENFFANTKNVNFYLSTENAATATAIFRVDDGFLGKFIIHDFDENRICVTGMKDFSGNTIDDPNLVFTAFRTVGSEEQQIETLYVVDGWLSAIAPVPEPSTWAAILGAVALAFAIRRRK